MRGTTRTSGTGRVVVAAALAVVFGLLLAQGAAAKQVGPKQQSMEDRAAGDSRSCKLAGGAIETTYHYDEAGTLVGIETKCSGLEQGTVYCTHLPEGTRCTEPARTAPPSGPRAPFVGTIGEATAGEGSGGGAGGREVVAVTPLLGGSAARIADGDPAASEAEDPAAAGEDPIADVIADAPAAEAPGEPAASVEAPVEAPVGEAVEQPVVEEPVVDTVAEPVAPVEEPIGEEAVGEPVEAEVGAPVDEQA